MNVSAAQPQRCDECGQESRIVGASTAAGPFLCESCITVGATRLRKIKARYGRIVMYRVARGMSIRDATRLGVPHVARRHVEHETTLAMAHVVGNPVNRHGISLADVVNESYPDLSAAAIGGPCPTCAEWRTFNADHACNTVTPCDQCGRPATHHSYGGGSYFHWCDDHPLADGSTDARLNL